METKSNEKKNDKTNNNNKYKDKKNNDKYNKNKNHKYAELNDETRKDMFLEKLNNIGYTLELPDIVVKERNTIRIICTNNHFNNVSFITLMKKKKWKCNTCKQKEKHDVDNDVIDKFLEEKKSNLVRIGEYPGSIYRATRFRCTNEDPHVVDLKWMVLKRRPYCQKCRKEKFQHKKMTKDLSKYVHEVYGAKLIEGFKGFKRIIKFQCSNGHIVSMSPLNVGFCRNPQRRQKMVLCGDCITIYSAKKK